MQRVPPDIRILTPGLLFFSNRSVRRPASAARAAANDAKVKEVILNAGSPILYQDTPDFERYVHADVHRMADVVKKIGKVE